jgi:hypothetical protein
VGWSIHSWLYDMCGCSVVLIHKDTIDQWVILGENRQLTNKNENG